MLQPPNQKHWMVRSDILMILLEGILFVCFVYFVVNSDCMDAADVKLPTSETAPSFTYQT